MDKAQFKAWLGSEAATQQLKAAVAEGTREDETICAYCGRAIRDTMEDAEDYRHLGIAEKEPACPPCLRQMAEQHDHGQYQGVW